VNATTRSADLFDLQSTVGRMAGNLGAVGPAAPRWWWPAATSTGWPTAYGDAGEWATIAKANGLTDPVIAGVQTCSSRPRPPASTGCSA
jgi:hypothetical protein